MNNGAKLPIGSYFFYVRSKDSRTSVDVIVVFFVVVFFVVVFFVVVFFVVVFLLIFNLCILTGLFSLLFSQIYFQR